MGCEKVVNNNLQIDTGIAKVTTGGTVIAPLGSQPVAGEWVADIPISSPLNTVDIAPVGSVYEFTGVTLANTNANAEAGAILDEWPTQYLVQNARMPAYWDFAWEHPSYCISQISPYPQLANPYEITDVVILPTTDVFWTPANPQMNFYCFQNSPANPDFVPTDVNPQVVLDNELPATVRVAAFSPVYFASDTNLRLFSMSLTNPANVTAESVASDYSSATFPYPTASNGAPLPAGAYIAVITTDPQFPSGTAQTTNGMEPLYIAHNDTTWTSAFGVDFASPGVVNTITSYSEQLFAYQYEECVGNIPTTTYGGWSGPIVTLPETGELAIGNSTNRVKVGLDPTVVIAYNNYTTSFTTSVGGCQPGTSVTTYSGAQSALVVNTGSNTVSLVSIGVYPFPSGTVVVGSQPVAAVINPAGTLAYIANYASGTISEISLQSVQETRTLAVAAHPTSVAFDSNGNLWVGGQGNLQLINLPNWSIWKSFAIDGTVTGMSYDTTQGAFVAQVLQNGSASSPSNGKTMSAAIAFNKAGSVSYSTTTLVNVASGDSVTPSAIDADSAPYANSSLVSDFAYPAQSAFNPPIYTSSGGDLVATANGTTFRVSALSTGKVLVGGTTPYPIRGVKLSPTMLYLTMPESNSLITLPLQLP
ncbi:MAG: hypothetical protein ABR907_14200 [Terracidiphilus sp.]